MVKPILLISACLEFDKVRYNGQFIPSETIRKLIPFVNFIKVCPEFEIGLGVPREPIRIVKKGEEYRLIQHNTNKDVTDDMNDFSEKFIEGIDKVDGFIFKSKSPTMGLKNIKVYSGMKGSPVIEKCGGFFAGRVADKFKGYPIEEEDRLRNRIIRDHFLIKLFLFADFRESQNLLNFHNRNKLLFSFYDKDKSNKLDINSDSYFEDIQDIMLKPPTTEKKVEFFRDYSGSLENKENFLEVVDKFKKNLINFDTLKEVARLFTNDNQLLNSSFFNPYPLELMPLAEEERDRDFWK